MDLRTDRFYRGSEWLTAGTTLLFLPERCVARYTDRDGTWVIQFIRGRELSEIEEELRDVLPISREHAQALQGQIAADLDPHIESNVVRGPLSTVWMNERLATMTYQQSPSQWIMLNQLFLFVTFVTLIVYAATTLHAR